VTILAIYAALLAGGTLGAAGTLLWRRGKLADIQRRASRVEQEENAHRAAIAALTSERDQYRHQVGLFDERDRQHTERVAVADHREEVLTKLSLEVLADLTRLAEERAEFDIEREQHTLRAPLEAAPYYEELGGVPPAPVEVPWNETFTGLWQAVAVQPEEEPAVPEPTVPEEPTPVDAVDRHAVEAFAVLDASGWNDLDGPELTAAIVDVPVKGAQHRVVKPAKKRGRKKHAHGGVR